MVRSHRILHGIYSCRSRLLLIIAFACTAGLIFASVRLLLKADSRDAAAVASALGNFAWRDVARDSSSASVHFDTYFDRIFYLNDADHTHARDVMRAYLRDVNIDAERFSKVSPNDPAVVFWRRRYLEEARHTATLIAEANEKVESPAFDVLNATDFAALKTMSALIDTARMRGYRRILVLSDCVRFHRDFKQEFAKKAGMLPSNWKLMYLGVDQYAWDAASAAPVPGLASAFYYPKRAYGGSFAVGIDSSAFDLLQFEIQKGVRTFDVGPLRSIVALFPNSAFVFTPNLIITDSFGSGEDSERCHESPPRTSTAQAVASPALFRWDMSLYSERPGPAPLPKVCVVVTFFNAADTISYSLLSILTQTYTNFELIVVDDSSTDNSQEILQQIAAQDPRLVIVRNPQNMGTYPSRNIGIKRCTGEVFMNHDGDDVSAPDRIASMIMPIIDNRAEMTTSLFIRAHLGVQELQHPWHELMLRINESRVHRHPNGRFKYCCQEKLAFATMMLKMSVFERIGLFTESRFSGDAEFMERYLGRTTMRFFTSEGGTMQQIHSFLWETPPIPPFYERIDRTLYVAADRNSSLSHAVPIKGSERLTYARVYQQKLLGALGINHKELLVVNELK